MKTRAEVMADGSDYLLSLSKLLPEGVSISDITGWISNEFGDPVFKVSFVVLSNGDTVSVEGEHDLPYLCEIDGMPEGQLGAVDEPEDPEEETP